MKIKAYNKFIKCYRTLPNDIQNKVDKQIELLVADFHHPSLHTKKIKGKSNIWELRVDINYRLTYEIIEDTIFLRVAGSHDEVLNNP